MKFRYKENKDTFTRQHYFPAGKWVEVTGEKNIERLIGNSAFEQWSEDKPPIDADNNGYLKKDEIKARLDAMGVQYPENAKRAELLELL